MCVCPCIIYETGERYQLDATILFIIINNSTCFGHLYAHLQEYISCVLLHMMFSTVQENCALVGGFNFVALRVLLVMVMLYVVLGFGVT
jgi:hypothetical protein